MTAPPHLRGLLHDFELTLITSSILSTPERRAAREKAFTHLLVRLGTQWEEVQAIKTQAPNIAALFARTDTPDARLYAPDGETRAAPQWPPVTRPLLAAQGPGVQGTSLRLALEMKAPAPGEICGQLHGVTANGEAFFLTTLLTIPLPALRRALAHPDAPEVLGQALSALLRAEMGERGHVAVLDHLAAQVRRRREAAPVRWLVGWAAALLAALLWGPPGPWGVGLCLLGASLSLWAADPTRRTDVSLEAMVHAAPRGQREATGALLRGLEHRASWPMPTVTENGEVRWHWAFASALAPRIRAQPSVQDLIPHPVTLLLSWAAGLALLNVIDPPEHLLTALGSTLLGAVISNVVVQWLLWRDQAKEAPGTSPPAALSPVPESPEQVRERVLVHERAERTTRELEAVTARALTLAGPDASPAVRERAAAVERRAQAMRARLDARQQGRQDAAALTELAGLEREVETAERLHREEP